MTWRIWHPQNALVHVVETDALSTLVIAELAERGHPLTPQPELPSILVQGAERAELYLDLGGSVRTDEPTERFAIGDTTFTVRSSHVGMILAKLRSLELRWFDVETAKEACEPCEGCNFGQPIEGDPTRQDRCPKPFPVAYVKLKIWHFAFVMTPEKRWAIVNALIEITERATAQ